MFCSVPGRPRARYSPPLLQCCAALCLAQESGRQQEERTGKRLGEPVVNSSSTDHIEISLLNSYPGVSKVII